MRKLLAGQMAALALVLLACGGEPGTATQGPTALDTLIEQAPDFYLPAGETVLQFNARVGEGVEQLVTLRASGYARVSAEPGGDIALERVEIALDDTTIGDKMSMSGTFRLTNVMAYLDARAECSHVDWTGAEDQCAAVIPATLVVYWSTMMTDGVMVELAPLTIRDVNYNAYIWEDGGVVDGGLVLDLSGQTPSVLWERSDLFEVTDFSLAVRGYQLISY